MLTNRISKNLFRNSIGVAVVLAFGLVAWASTPSGININGDMITNGVATTGSVTSVTGSGSSRSINTGSAETIIRYDRFNVDQGWNINIQQPTASSATLNKVMGGCASEILGTFRSNGQVFLVNPAGILFGPSARINMPKLIASGNYLSDNDFRKMANLPLHAGDNSDNMVTFTAPGSGGRIMTLYEDSKCEGFSRPQFSTDALYLIGTQVENCARIVGYTDGAKPYVVMAAATGKVMVSNYGQQNVLIEVTAGPNPTDGDPVPPRDVSDRHQNQTGKGHTLFQNGYAYGHYGDCPDCLTTTLGSGDIYSLAVVDTSLTAMTAQHDISIVADDVTGSNGLGRGSLTSAGNILLDAGHTTSIDRDVIGGGIVNMDAGQDNLVGNDVQGQHVGMTAGHNNSVGGDVTALGTESIVMTAGADNVVGGDVVATSGPVTMTAGGKNDVGGDVSGSSVAMNAGTDNIVDGDVTASTGSAAITAGRTNDVGGVSGGSVSMTAGTDNLVGGSIHALAGAAAIWAGHTNDIDGDVTATGGNVTMTAGRDNLVGGSVSATGDTQLTATDGDNNISGNVSGTHVGIIAGSDNIIGGNVLASGTTSIVMTAAGDNLVGGDVIASNGPVTMTAGGKNDVGGDVTGTSVTMTADTDNRVDGSVEATDGTVLMTANNGENDVHGDVSATGSVTMNAYITGNLEVMPGSGENEVGGNVTGTSVSMYADTNNEVDGDVTGTSGAVLMTADAGHNTVNLDVSGTAITMDAYTNNEVSGDVTGTGNVVMTAATGHNGVGGNVSGAAVTMNAYTDNEVDGDVTGTGDVQMNATHGNNVVGGNVSGNGVSMYAQGNNVVDGDVTAGALAYMYANWGANIVGGSVTGQNVNIDGCTYNDINGDVTATGGDARVYVYEGNNYLGGDVTAQGNVLLDAAANVLDGTGDQSLTATNGKLTVHGDTDKVTAGNLYMQGGAAGVSVDIADEVHTVAGNIEITGNGDVQIGGNITAGVEPCYNCDTIKDFVAFAQEVQDGLNYGVKIVSDNGQIYTGTPEDGINVVITGGSDQMTGRGVDLPFQAGQKAGIVLMSKGDLTIGADGMLVTTGNYYADGSVDDRAAVNFRDTSNWQGIPIDVALYLKSTAGDIKVDHLAQLNVVTPGTAVVDAFNFVRLTNHDNVGAGIFCNDPYYLYRLEVASRQVLWLQEAIDTGKLPFPEDFPVIEALMGGGTFVLRGGVDPEGINGAWVLHAPDTQPDVYPLIPAPVVTPTDDGCPALLQAAAEEIGQDPAVFRTGTFVSMKSLQPCNTCERLVRTANVLKDPDGKHMAALGQALGDFAGGPAPLTPEQMATAMQTIALQAKDNKAYASAQEWVDSLATYVGILQSEVGLTQADAIALATGKYGSPAGASDAVKAFIAQELAKKAG
jgi:filamentous hemagglutinin family protein